MNDLGQILPLWRELENSGVDYVLATVVAVEGSSYRKPGARMLLTDDGRRAGTVSGGCLESEVARGFPIGKHVLGIVSRERHRHVGRVRMHRQLAVPRLAETEHTNLVIFKIGRTSC